MDMQSTARPIRITCARGLAGWLEQEVETLGLAVEDRDDSGVEVSGTLADAMRLNLHLRTAMYVLCLLDEFTCLSADDLYRRTSFVPWEELLNPDGYFSVMAHVDSPAISNDMFAAVRVKDAVVDRMAEVVGRRPDSGPQRDRAVVNVYWRGDTCRLYLNTSGRKLADRGYRRMPHKAPMQETLAAGVILATGYDGREPLVNPMCGSGTLAIEAALIAAGRPPALLRDNFGFMHVRGFDEPMWQRLRQEARKRSVPSVPGRIIATDIDERAIAAARQNARTAGVEQLIDFAVCDFAETTIPQGPGVVVLNPEYGQRMGVESSLESVYARVGDFFKQRCGGYRGYIFTGNPGLAKKVGLRARRRLPFFNARIECRLLEYELYAGSRRKPDL